MNYEYKQGMKYLWKMPQVDQEKVNQAVNDFHLSRPVAQALVARGFTTKSEIEDFLFVSKEKDVFDPALMKDAQKAVDRLLLAIEKKEKILIFGDYDVDGITSSSLLLMALLPLGANVNFYLPNRVTDGYGISTKIVKKAAENGYTVMVTVDNGTTAFEPAKKAKELGIDLIITDHHRPHAELPDVFALVNPHQEDCAYPFKEFAGVGVIFKVVSLLYQQKNIELPSKVVELLLFGTVADVVPLMSENRYWVRHGLAHVNQHESYALSVLKRNSSFLKPKVDSLDIGFFLAPQINALGRLDDPRSGVRFLIGNDTEEVDRVGKVLFEMNQARKQVERSIVDEIEQLIESKKINLATENIIIAASQHWPAGVIGLVASRIVSKYGRPTLLFHLTKDGLAKGSCRSIQEFNMFDALTESKNLLITFGGHSLAAGLSLKASDVAELKAFLEEKIARELTDFDLQQKLQLDTEADLSDLNDRCISDMTHLEPFGHKNHQPYFHIKDVVLVQRPTLMKDLHVKCLLFSAGVVKPVVFFNRPELFDFFLNHGDKSFDVVVQVSQNYWNEKYSIQLMGIDIAVKEEKN